MQMYNSIAAQYQTQPWIMEPTALKAFAERLMAMPQSSDVFAIKVDETPKPLQVTDGIARIAITGVLLDSVPAWLRLMQIEATGYDSITAQITEAVDRVDVKEIELVVDSPGGVVGTVISAADAIYRARAIKPVSATISVLGASGAYWLASQADTITAADANTRIGSIGVFTWYLDLSGHDAAMGVKVIVVRSGEHKAMGLDKVSDTQIAAVQQYIDAMAGNFITAVARGRRAEPERIEELATGQLWIAADARELGLIDQMYESPTAATGSADITANADQQTNHVGENPMTAANETTTETTGAVGDASNAAVYKSTDEARTTTVADERARAAELQAEFADDPGFALRAVAEGWSLEQAKAKYCDVLRNRVSEQSKELDAAEKKLTNCGAEAIVSDDSDDAGGGDFVAEAREMAAEKNISVTEAMRRIRRSNRALHENFKSKCAAGVDSHYVSVA
jgi:signal peptide peptidase SppA